MFNSVKNDAQLVNYKNNINMIIVTIYNLWYKKSKIR